MNITIDRTMDSDLEEEVFSMTIKERLRMAKKLARWSRQLRDSTKRMNIGEARVGLKTMQREQIQRN
jgi:hypothetical protein